jgi:hypothetical protein
MLDTNSCYFFVKKIINYFKWNIDIYLINQHSVFENSFVIGNKEKIKQLIYDGIIFSIFQNPDIYWYKLLFSKYKSFSIKNIEVSKINFDISIINETIIFLHKQAGFTCILPKAKFMYFHETTNSKYLPTKNYVHIVIDGYITDIYSALEISTNSIKIPMTFIGGVWLLSYLKQENKYLNLISNLEKKLIFLLKKMIYFIDDNPDCPNRHSEIDWDNAIDEYIV